MIRYLTAGESHGKALTTTIEGFPSNLEIEAGYINNELKRRQSGYGRGMRMKIESDEVEILSGIRFGKTLGSPISYLIRNRDWENWTDRMAYEKPGQRSERITVPRPAHADLVGSAKYNFDDIRNSIERSSARETAARVAAGASAKKLLSYFSIKVGSFVESIGGIYPEKSFFDVLLKNGQHEKFDPEELSGEADQSEVRVLEKSQEEKIIEKVKEAKKKGDTLGGTMVAVVTGLPVGLGSFVHYDRKLDAAISRDIMSVNAVKGVEIGGGFAYSDSFGSEKHDEILIKGNKFTRRTNFAGGIEGGTSNGMPIIVRAAMKPIATLMSPIGTVDLATLQEVEARRERSDFTAVPACAVILESVLAWTISEFFLEKFGGDSVEEIMENFVNYESKLFNRIKNNFSGKEL